MPFVAALAQGQRGVTPGKPRGKNDGAGSVQPPKSCRHKMWFDKKARLLELAFHVFGNQCQTSGYTLP